MTWRSIRRIWFAVRGVCAAVPLTIMATVALSAITAAINERACAWTMQGGLAVSAALALAVPLIGIGVAVRECRDANPRPRYSEPDTRAEA